MGALLKILLVDDNRTNLKLLRVILEAHDHVVKTAIDGLEALAFLNSDSVDVIISDILMPRMDGYRLCYEVRRNPLWQDIAFIFYTSTYTSKADESLCFNLGADDYLVKPTPIAEFLEAIEDATKAVHRKPIADPSLNDVWRQYSERLISKLEEKYDELQDKTDELNIAHEQLINLLEHSPAINYALRIEGQHRRASLVSGNIERIFGISTEDANMDWWTSAIHPEDRERVAASQRFASDQLSLTHEYRVRHVNGTYIWIEDSSRILRNADGEPSELIGVWLDITGRKEAEEKLRNSLETLEQRVQSRTSELAELNLDLVRAREAAVSENHSKSEFLSRMSHELRTPMNSILGFGQLLELTRLDQDQSDSVRHILKAGRHLLRLINEVLEISRIETGNLTVSLETVDVDEVVEETVTLMRPAAQEGGITLTAVPFVNRHIKADRQRLRQVLLNLVSNGIKYNNPGGFVKIQELTTTDSNVTIEVVDNGIGISVSMRNRLFTPFDRLSAAETTIEGTGLGLTLSRALTQAMDGELTVESTQGVGSSFKITLSSADSPSPADSLFSRGFLERKLLEQLTGKILLIEDNAMNLKLLTRLFRECPAIQFVTAIEGREGIQKAIEFRPDAILLDLHLPDMSGADVLKELKGLTELEDVPIIIVTADAFSNQSRKLIEAGAFRYLTKPFVLNDLINAVSDALNK